MRGTTGAERREFYDALQRLLRVYQFRERDRACYGDVTPDECYALEAIDGREGVRVNDLAAALGLHKSNASRLARALERKGYAARAREHGDGRAVRLRATARGRAVHAAIRRRIEGIHGGILGAFDARTRAACVRLLLELAREAEGRIGRQGAETRGRTCT
jgi:DNA-binding MarR family transcriptional regulator